ncbi:uncharacterized protein G2W53_002928 [Senna tora]|uniref:Uncharacterized protein n=1 Tax=Senna tora TaxID=362788 RepID=A0A835CHZ9_9FABA|nr:uncharacterized protein G2W53_002928 [Senna tora]
MGDESPKGKTPFIIQEAYANPTPLRAITVACY